MQLVEQHVIKRADPRFAIVDAAAFASAQRWAALMDSQRAVGSGRACADSSVCLGGSVTTCRSTRRTHQLTTSGSRMV
jgi:hypothetical protein